MGAAPGSTKSPTVAVSAATNQETRVFAGGPTDYIFGLIQSPRLFTNSTTYRSIPFRVHVVVLG